MSYIQMQFTCPDCHRVWEERNLFGEIDYNNVYIKCPECGSNIAYCPLEMFLPEPPGIEKGGDNAASNA